MGERSSSHAALQPQGLAAASPAELPPSDQAQHRGLPTFSSAMMLCSSICIVSRHKLVPATPMYQTYHLESTLAQQSSSYTTLHAKEVVRNRRGCSRFFSSCSPTKNPAGTCIYLLMNLLQQTTVEIGHFLTGGGRETKLCLLSTQEKLTNSCKSTPKSEHWVWLSMVQKMSGILIESRLSHVFMLTAFIIVTARAKLMLPCCLVKYISSPNSIN